MVVMSETDDPVDVGSLGMDGIVVNPENPTDLFKNFGLLTLGGGRHRIFLQSRAGDWLIIATEQKCPKNPIIITLSGQSCLLINC